MSSPDKRANMVSPEKGKPTAKDLAAAFFGQASITKADAPAPVILKLDSPVCTVASVSDIAVEQEVSANSLRSVDAELQSVIDAKITMSDETHGDQPLRQACPVAVDICDVTTPAKKPRKRDASTSVKKAPAASPLITLPPGVDAKVSLYLSELENLLCASIYGYIQSDIPINVSYTHESDGLVTNSFFLPQSKHILSISHLIRRSSLTVSKLLAFRATNPNPDHTITTEHLPLVARLCQDSTLPLQPLSQQVYSILYALPWADLLNMVADARTQRNESINDIAALTSTSASSTTSSSSSSSTVDSSSTTSSPPTIDMHRVHGPPTPSALALMHVEAAISLACERKWYGLPHGVASLDRDGRGKKGKKEREEEEELAIEGACVWEAVGASEAWDVEKSRITSNRRVRKGFEGLVKAYRGYIEGAWRGFADSKLDGLEEKVVKAKRERVELAAKWLKEREKEEEKEKKAAEALREKERKQKEKEEKEKEKEKERLEKEAAKEASKKAQDDKKKEEEEKKRRANASFMSKFLQKAPVTPVTPSATTTASNSGTGAVPDTGAGTGTSSTRVSIGNIFSTTRIVTPSSTANKPTFRFRPYQLPLHAHMAPRPCQPDFLRKPLLVLPENAPSRDIFLNSLRTRFAATLARRRRCLERRRQLAAQATEASNAADMSMTTNKAEKEPRHDKHAVLLVSSVHQPHATVGSNIAHTLSSSSSTISTGVLCSATVGGDMIDNVSLHSDSLPSDSAGSVTVGNDCIVMSDEPSPSEVIVISSNTSQSDMSNNSDVVILDGDTKPSVLSTTSGKKSSLPENRLSRHVPPSRRPKLLQFVENRVRPPWYGPWPRGILGLPLSSATAEHPAQVIPRVWPRRPLFSYPHVCYGEDSEDEWEAGSDDESVDKDDSEEEESDSEVEEGFLEEGDIDKKSVSDAPPSLLGPFVPVVNTTSTLATVKFTAQNLMKPGSLTPTAISVRERLGSVASGLPSEFQRFLPRVQCNTIPMVTFEPPIKRRKRARRGRAKGKVKAADEAMVSLASGTQAASATANISAAPSAPTAGAGASHPAGPITATTAAVVPPSAPAPVTVLPVRRKVPVVLIPTNNTAATAITVPTTAPAAAPVAVPCTAASTVATTSVAVTPAIVPPVAVTGAGAGVVTASAPTERRRITPALISVDNPIPAAPPAQTGMGTSAAASSVHAPVQETARVGDVDGNTTH